MASVEFSSSYSVSYWGSIQAQVRVTFSETYNSLTNATTLNLTGLEFKKNGSTNLGSIPVFGSISVNGTTVCTINNTGGGKSSYVSLSGSGWCSAGLSSLTKTPVTVTHNADGSKSVTVTVTAGAQSRFCARYEWYHQYSTDPGTGHALYRTDYIPFGVPTSSATMALTTRPRISSVTATNAYIGEPVTITMDRYNSAFTHTVTASCAGHTETLMTKGSTYPTLTWTPALATYAPLITNAMAATATITCQTYNGGTLIGQSTATCTLTLKAADVAPSVSIATADPTGNLTTYGKYVKGKSKITVTLTPTLAYGASLVTQGITANGASYNTSPATTDFILSASSTGITATITDSRGQTATATATIQIYDYDAPMINEFTAHRCNSDGTDNNAGAYMAVVYDIEVSPLGNQNAKTLTVKYKKIADQNYQTATITLSSYTEAGTSQPIAVDTNSTYNVQLVLEDDFATGQSAAMAALVLPTASTRMNWGAGENGGIAIGKVSEHNKTLEIADDWEVKIGGSLTIAGKTILDLIYPVGSIYMSVNSTSPATFIGGTWEQLKDRFLLGAGDTYSNGATGGEATHTLTKSELPAEKLNIYVSSGWLGYKNTTANAGSGIAGLGYQDGTALKTENMGSGNAHNNMPPYLVVYIWKRTA